MSSKKRSGAGSISISKKKIKTVEASRCIFLYRVLRIRSVPPCSGSTSLCSISLFLAEAPHISSNCNVQKTQIQQASSIYFVSSGSAVQNKDFGIAGQSRTRSG